MRVYRLLKIHYICVLLIIKLVKLLNDAFNLGSRPRMADNVDCYNLQKHLQIYIVGHSGPGSQIKSPAYFSSCRWENTALLD